MTVGQLTAFTMYLGQLIWPMFAAGWVLSLIERGKAAWARLDPLLREPLSVDDHGDARAATGRRDPVRAASRSRIRRRSSRAPTEAAAACAVADVVVRRCDPAQTLGIVGPTGAGKSTLLHLLLRHYALATGAIRWGGRALADYTLASLRAAIAWVPQEPFLFSATIADNIALARADATRAEIERAARHGGPARRHPALSARATTRWSASAASRCRAGSGSGWRSRARCLPMRRCCCSTMR